MDKQRPLSRAYRSFYAAPKEEGEVVVHLGSGAATAPSTTGGEEALQGKGGVAGTGGGDENGRGGIADDIFEGSCVRRDSSCRAKLVFMGSEKFALWWRCHGRE